MSEKWENWQCDVCGQMSLRRVVRPYEAEVSHDGRPPVTIRIPNLEVIACTNPDCHPANPDGTIIEDDATAWQITTETYRQLGLLTPDEIRAGRETLGLNQQELQRLLGLGGNSLSRWESGRVYQSRSMDSLLRVIFNVPDALAFLGRLQDPQVPSMPRLRAAGG
jgi:putative zinc finger/helix-turn-helix YgiT family protein